MALAPKFHSKFPDWALCAEKKVWECLGRKVTCYQCPRQLPCAANVTQPDEFWSHSAVFMICIGCRLRLLGQATRTRPLLPLRGRTTSAYPRTAAVFYQSQDKRWLGSQKPVPTEDGQTVDEAKYESEDNNRDAVRFSELELTPEQQLHEAPAVGEDDAPSHPKPKRSRRAEDKDAESDPQGSAHTESRAWRDPRLETFMRKLNLQRQHRSRNRILNETSANLGANVLGQPAYAIVMKDLGTYKKKKIPLQAEGIPEVKKKSRRSSTETDHSDFGVLLDNDLDLPGVDEVRNNIGELRPESDTFISRNKYLAIRQKLEDGFLKSQLRDYLENLQGHKGSQIARGKKGRKRIVPTVSQYKWIKGIGQSSSMSGDDLMPSTDFDRPNGVRDGGPKARLAGKIMQECWGLQIDDQMGRMVDVKLAVEELEFTMLMRNKQKFFSHLREMLFEPGEHIEADASVNIIRIVSAHQKLPTIIAELDTIVQKLSTASFRVFGITSDPTQFDEALLEEVGRITNTHVGLSDNKDRIHVTCFTEPGQDKSGVESLRHVVYRLLCVALQPELASRGLHACPSYPADSKGRFLADLQHKEAWSWKDRLSEWARYIMPISAPTINVSDNSAAAVDNYVYSQVPKEDAPLPVLDLLPLEQPSSRPSAGPSTSSPQYWSTNLTTITEATFGHVLHAHSEGSEGLSHYLSAVLKHADQRRIFSPVIPHPKQLATIQDNPTRPQSPITSTIVIRLMPTPEAAQQPRSVLPLKAPPLELRLSLSEPDTTAEAELDIDAEKQTPKPRVTGVHSLRAIHHTRIHDILQPSESVDMRIVQTQSATLCGSPDALTAWSPVAQLLSKARLDFGAGKLEMPPQQKFYVPTELFSAPPDSLSETSGGAGGAHKNEAERAQKLLLQQASSSSSSVPGAAVRATEYDFAGLELHRSVSIPLPGDEAFTLTYTSIEAGQGGGRRAELALRPVPMSHVLQPEGHLVLPDEQQLGGASGERDEDGGSRDAAHGEDGSHASGCGGGSGSDESAPPLTTGAPALVGGEDGATDGSLAAVAAGDEQRQDAFLRACYKLARDPNYWQGLT
ncbi:mitochondrial inner-membrane-bound regulator-domain-containing protein [Xylariales sp. PMI_506]|nr:mitochondrial inner-membrane-bound regulator-domain-containing protein [Xylariales sp. PMI_506]